MVEGRHQDTPVFPPTLEPRPDFLLRRLQRGEKLGLPHSRPMPTIGPRCHELRIRDRDHTWRIIYRLDVDAILILAIFEKKTPTTPKATIDDCRRRLRHYDEHVR